MLKPRQHTCPVCGEDITHEYCHGTGKIPEEFGLGHIECKTCGGSGKMPHKHHKSGSGRSKRSVDVSIKIK